MDILLQTYYTVLPIVVTSLMGYVVWALQNGKKQEKVRIEEESKKREANAQGTRVMLLYMLERLYEEYKLQNCVTHEQRDRFAEIYNAYHNLGGNGYGTALWNSVKELEIRNDVDGVSPYAKLLKEAMQKWD